MPPIIRRGARAPLLPTSLAAAVLAALALPSAALASGFQIKENSAMGLGRAFAGSAAMPDDASVVVNNPAAMSLLDRAIFDANVSVIDFNSDFSGGGTDALGRPLSGGDGGDPGDPTLVPALFYATPLGDGWHVGASLTAPFGLATEYDDGWVGRYQALTSDVKTIDLSLAASYELTPAFSLGGAVLFQYAEAELSNAVDFGAILAGQGVPGFAPTSADGQAVVEGDDTAVGWQLGALWQVSEATNLGFNYRSRIKHKLEGDVDFRVPGDVEAVFGAIGSPLFQDTGVTAPLSTPEVATLSLFHRVNPDVSIGADVSWTGWSRFDEIRISYDNPAQPTTIDEQNWKDSWFYSVGGDWRVNDDWTLRAGLAYDETPTVDEYRTPRLGDGDRRWLSLGFTYNGFRTLQWHVGYAHLWVDDASIDNVSGTGSTLTGEFESDVDLLSIGATMRF